MLTTAKQPSETIVLATSAIDLFRKFRRETAQLVRQADVKENKALKALKVAWRKYEYQPDMSVAGLDDKNYENAISAIKGITYSAKDVALFSVGLSEFADEEHLSSKAGFFISALVNNGNETDYKVFVSHIEEIRGLLKLKISWLGYRNTKNLTIEGNIEACAGDKMQSGQIIVNGNVRGTGLGNFMEGGRIIVNGNMGTGVGIKMKNGEIIVNGNACANIGDNMQGGVIRINGDVSTGFLVGSSMKGGEIHVSGKLDLRGFDLHIISGKVFHNGKLIAGEKE